MAFLRSTQITLKLGPHRVWQSNILFLLLYLLTLVIFLSLCHWQISRAKEKETIITLAQQKANLPAIPISPKAIFQTDRQQALENFLYQKVQIQGRWLPSYTYLQDNVTYDGIAGYEVLTPFQTLDGTVILINRGWINKQQYHPQLLDMGAIIHTQDTHRITGLWVLPTQRFTLSDSPYPKDFPKIIQQVDHDKITMDIQQPLAPLQLRLQEMPKNSPLSLRWQPIYGSPDKHYAYALQWFFFASILTFLFIKLNLKKIPT